MEPVQEELDAANQELLLARKKIVQVMEELVAAKEQLAQKCRELVASVNAEFASCATKLHVKRTRGVFTGFCTEIERALSTRQTAGGFAGYWGQQRTPQLRNLLHFEAPSVLTNTLGFVDKNGKEKCFPPARASPCSSSASATPSARPWPSCSRRGTSIRTQGVRERAVEQEVLLPVEVLLREKAPTRLY
ncbi:hypothetical protein ABZP36_033138 [Zizania latifolia]